MSQSRTDGWLLFILDSVKILNHCFHFMVLRSIQSRLLNLANTVVQQCICSILL